MPNMKIARQKMHDVVLNILQGNPYSSEPSKLEKCYVDFGDIFVGRLLN